MNGKTIRLLILALGFFWLAPLNIQAAGGAEPPAGGAESTSIEALRHEVEMLKQTVRRLEEVISEMEKQPSHPKTPLESTTPRPVDKTAPAAVPAVQEATGPPAAAAAEPSALPDTGRGSSSATVPAAQEATETPAAAAAVTATPGNTANNAPSLSQQWRSIERGMGAEQIEALLGAPQQKFSVGGNTVWYYQYPNNRRGSVTFSGDRQVSGWQKPPFGGF
jgi:hypothetical protein